MAIGVLGVLPYYLLRQLEDETDVFLGCYQHNAIRHRGALPP